MDGSARRVTPLRADGAGERLVSIVSDMQLGVLYCPAMATVVAVVGESGEGGRVEVRLWVWNEEALIGRPEVIEVMDFCPTSNGSFLSSNHSTY